MGARILFIGLDTEALKRPTFRALITLSARSAAPPDA
jgi:hypothetical protein